MVFFLSCILALQPPGTSQEEPLHFAQNGNGLVPQLTAKPFCLLWHQPQAAAAVCGSRAGNNLQKCRRTFTRWNLPLHCEREGELIGFFPF